MANKQLLNKIKKVENEKNKLNEKMLEIQSEISAKDEYLKKLYDIRKKEEKLEEQQRMLNEEINAV